LLTAIGLFFTKNWARFLGGLLAALGLFNVPLGTVVSAIVIYFLFLDERTLDLFYPASVDER